MVLFLKLVCQEFTQSLRHRLPAGPEGETVHLRTKDTQLHWLYDCTIQG